jgi:hypothetical protein
MGLTIEATPPTNEMMLGFLANFCHILHEFNEPFFFPAKVQQVFFWSEPKTPCWKVVLRREPRSCWVVVDTCDDCIDIPGVVLRLESLRENSKFR